MAEKEGKKPGSLKNRLFAITLIPLTIMTIVIVLASRVSVRNALMDNTKRDMERTAQLTLDMYDKTFPGEYHLGSAAGEADKIVPLKGESNILGNNEIVDELKNILNVEVSLFMSKYRVATTIMDRQGNRFIAFEAKSDYQAPARVDSDVIKGGKATFYTDVKLGDENCCAYYMPILNEAGDVIGMVGVAKRMSDIEAAVWNNMWPIAAVAIISTIIFALIIISSVRTISRRLKGVEDFIAKVAKGRFDNDIAVNVMTANDEISSLADNGRTMQDSIRKLVECDALTGLNNRRFGNNKLASIRQASERNGAIYCLGICDIDHFKRVNDTYGHDAGDEILKAVADQLKKGMGGNGYVARWGGEEFMVIFPNKDVNEAEKVLNTIREKIQAMETKYGDQIICVTLSAGVTQGRPGETDDDTLKRADENLYYAKEHGRNQVLAK